MGKTLIKNSIVGKKDGNNSSLMLSNERETSAYFSPQELSEYEKIVPNFGKDYLQSVLNVPQELKIERNRNYSINKVSIIIASFIIGIYLLSIVFLLYNEKYEYATTIIIGTLFAIVALFVKSTNTKAK